VVDIDPTKVKQNPPASPDQVADSPREPRPKLAGVAQKSFKEILGLLPDLSPNGLSISDARFVIDDQWLEDLQKTLRSSAPESRASSSPVTNKY
jgi:hypothetical protein